MAGPLQGPAAAAAAATPGSDRTPYERTPYGTTAAGVGGKARYSRSVRAANFDRHQQQRQKEPTTTSSGALTMPAARHGPYDRPAAGRHASAGPQAAARRSGATRAGSTWVGSAASKLISGASSFLASFFRRSSSQEEEEEEQPLSPQMETNDEEAAGGVAEIVTVEEKVTQELDIEGMLSERALSREQCDRFIKLLQSKLDETTSQSRLLQSHAVNGVIEDHGRRRLYPDEELSRDLQNREVFQEHAATSPVDIAKAYMGKHLAPTPPPAMPMRTLDYLEASAGKKEEFESTPRIRVATPGHTPYVRLPPRYTEGIRASPYSLTSRERKRRADAELDYGRKTRHKLSNGPQLSTLGNGSYLERMKKVHKISKANTNATRPDAAAHVPTKSTDTAKKILETLEILTPPKGKRLEEEMAVIRDRRPEDLLPSKLNDQARKSMQKIEFEVPQEYIVLAPPASNPAGPSSHDGAGPSSSEGLLRVPASIDSKDIAGSNADGEGVTRGSASELPQQTKGFRMFFTEELNSDDEPSVAPVSAMDTKVDKSPSTFTTVSAAAPSSLSIGVKSGFSFPFAANLPEPITPKPMPSAVPGIAIYPANRETATDRTYRVDNVPDLDVRPSVLEPLFKPEPATASTVSVSAPGAGLSNGSAEHERNVVQAFTEGEERSSKRQMNGVEDQKATEATTSDPASAPFSFGVGKPPVPFGFSAHSNGALESSTGRETASSSQAGIPGSFTKTISKSTAEPGNVSETAAPSSSAPGSSPTFSFQSTPATASANASGPTFELLKSSAPAGSTSPTESKPVFGFSTPSTVSLPSSVSSIPFTLGSAQPKPLFGSPATAVPAPLSGSPGGFFGASSSSAAATTTTATTTTTVPTLTSSTTVATAASFSSGSFSQPAVSFSFGASTPSTSASLFSSPGAPLPIDGTNTSLPVAATGNSSPNNNDMMEDTEEPSSQAATTSLFGGQSSSQFTFGQSSPAFGASSFSSGQTSVFGLSQAALSQSAPAFGLFGASSQPSTFGASTSAFGTSQAPVFGSFSAQTSTSYGSQSAPVFGAASTPAFGTAASTPAFGTAASTPAFGAASTPAFGAPASTPGFGAAASSPAFGAAAGMPVFGAAGSSPAFGAAQSTPPLFGGTPAQPFGAAQSAPAFGAAQSAPAFGAAQSVPAFGAGQSSPALFGQPAAATAAPAFGSSSPVFGSSQSAPSFQFGAAAAQSGPSFGGSQPAFTFGAAQNAAPFGAPDFGGGNVFAAGATDSKANRRIIKPRKTTAKRK